MNYPERLRRRTERTMRVASYLCESPNPCTEHVGIAEGAIDTYLDNDEAYVVDRPLTAKQQEAYSLTIRHLRNAGVIVSLNREDS